ncbi:MAG: CoA transferase subunit A [Polyangia bacterium]
MNKVFSDAEHALFDVAHGVTVLVGGFGLCGIPEDCIDALYKKGVRDLHIISNNCGIDGKGLGRLLQNGQVRSIVGSYVGENKTFERLYLEGKLDVELCPQGSLAERIRAGGAGIPAFFTPAGYGTVRAEGKETRSFKDRLGRERHYILETALTGDFALVKAWKGDRAGNLVFRKTARNFNPIMATAGRITIAEVEELVEPGQIEPDQVHTPGIYVKRLFVAGKYEKAIEQRTVRPRPRTGAAS